jgi:hypothetical protein
MGEQDPQAGRDPPIRHIKLCDEHATTGSESGWKAILPEKRSAAAGPTGLLRRTNIVLIRFA